MNKRVGKKSITPRRKKGTSKSILETLSIYGDRLSEIDVSRLSYFEIELYIRATMRLKLLYQVAELLTALDKSIESLMGIYSSRVIEDPENLEEFNKQLTTLTNNIKQIYQMLTDRQQQGVSSPVFNIQGEQLDISFSNPDMERMKSIADRLEKMKPALDKIMENLNIFEDGYEQQ